MDAENTAPTPALPEFKDFGKITRFRKLECQISEKIDGSNAHVYVPIDDSEPVLAASRNRWVTPEKDNFGFAKFVYEHADLFRLLGPGRHYGEFFGAGIQRRYGLNEKRLYLFNVDRYAGDLPVKLKEALGTQIGLVPILYRGPVDSNAINEVIANLYRSGSVAVPGWLKPEGVVINIGGQRYKVTDNGDEHKGV